jgi:hypothetical protein
MKCVRIWALLCALSLVGAISLGAQSGSSVDPGTQVSPSPSVAPSPVPATVSVPRLIKFSGSVTDTQRHPMQGTVGITFALYANQQGGSPLWLETQNVTLETEGRYAALLGSTRNEGLPLNIFAPGEAHWLRVQVQGQAEQSRLLVSVPYTLKAAEGETLDGQPASVFVLREGASGATGTISEGGTETQASSSGTGTAGTVKAPAFQDLPDPLVEWLVTGNAGTTAGTHFVGTTDNMALELKVNGERALRLEPASTPNVIGGYSGNNVGGGIVGATIGGGGDPSNVNQVTGNYGTVGGGQGNTASADFATIGGGGAVPIIGKVVVVKVGPKSSAPWVPGNRVTDEFGTVGGGGNNQAGDNAGTTADARFATVGGGGYNVASGEAATVGGGSANVANGSQATVGGGQGNVAIGAYATVPGGHGNAASGEYATVDGGWNNTASESDATVGGGRYNVASAGFATIGGGGPDDKNTLTRANRVTDEFGTVGGGGNNQAGDNAGTTADARFATVGGGQGNTARADHATVGGGGYNVASAGFATIGGGGPDDVITLGRANRVTDEFGTVGGGGNNQAGNNYGTTTDAKFATVGGGQGNTARADHATVGGGQGNTARADHATVGGGQGNIVRGDHATVGGGGYNVASAGFATIGGGGPDDESTFARGNRVTDEFGTVGGGISTPVGDGPGNTADARFATVGGGQGNTARADHATVGGGRGNSAGGDYATVGRGWDNHASGLYATLPGGHGNAASKSDATVGGGQGNRAGGEYATVGGGWDNLISADYATIGGGGNNAAIGAYATVPGGTHNTAGGPLSFAAGNHARAYHQGTFVWADSTDADFASTANNQFLIRASGGVGIGTNRPAVAGGLHVVRDIDAPASKQNHVAVIENLSAGTSPDVLALVVGTPSNPSGDVNFITFMAHGGGQALGAVQGNGKGGVFLKSPGSDYAEYFPKQNPEDALEPGETVGLRAGRVSRQTRDAERVLVVTTSPIVLGNQPLSAREGDFARLALVGQVPVHVRRPVHAGDYLVASGDDDGNAVAVAPAALTLANVSGLVGRALEGSQSVHGGTVQAEVGLPEEELLASLLRTRDHQLELQAAELTALKSELEETRALLEKVRVTLAAQSHVKLASAVAHQHN